MTQAFLSTYPAPPCAKESRTPRATSSRKSTPLSEDLALSLKFLLVVIVIVVSLHAPHLDVYVKKEK